MHRRRDMKDKQCLLQGYILFLMVWFFEHVRYPKLVMNWSPSVPLMASWNQPLHRERIDIMREKHPLWKVIHDLDMPMHIEPPWKGKRPRDISYNNRRGVPKQQMESTPPLLN